MDGKAVRIGTRDSLLANWQAGFVKHKIETLGLQTRLFNIKSSGDKELIKPLYEMRAVGIFTRALDTALLQGDIDIAVHSMKDVPTQLPEGIKIFAVMERGDYQDVLINKNYFDKTQKLTIATGSLRRKAQWLHKYPHHKIENIRGNVPLRLEKLRESKYWSAAIFAKVGLDRLQIDAQYEVLDWMIPAPAQGAIVVLGRKKDKTLFESIYSLEDKATEICTSIERQFLRTLEGGCTAPIGALATIEDETKVHFRGVLLSENGSSRSYVEEKKPLGESKNLGEYWARDILRKGGEAILKKI
ncbi:hydroxymethylbilane synthase [Elysia marginata]|uniref:hydroxymethylbilane synthase n=1 Tax=Elysia marginata TaxID=1093978 RepID=A0AAV4F8A0_9GAST|nr:hydroxymethylbilane synthase [Elysia marginata]